MTAKLGKSSAILGSARSFSIPFPSWAMAEGFATLPGALLARAAQGGGRVFLEVWSPEAGVSLRCTFAEASASGSTPGATRSPSLRRDRQTCEALVSDQFGQGF